MSSVDPRTPRERCGPDALSAESPGCRMPVDALDVDRGDQPAQPEFTLKDLYAIWKEVVFSPLVERGIQPSTLPDAVMLALSACRRSLANVRRRNPVSPLITCPCL